MNLMVREASAGDSADIADISRNTWEGHDYLEGVSSDWLKDSGFIVGEINGRVIACGKITMMPGGVAWLEGLRVHPDFRGKGFGRVMSDRILEMAREQVDRGRFSSIEFSTYINNVESRTMAERQGFRVIDLFHVIGLDEPAESSSMVDFREVAPEPADFAVYTKYAPCGWKFIHSSAPGTVDWMKRNARFWQVDTGARFLTSVRGFEISPLSSAFEDPDGFVNGAVSLARSKKMSYLEMMIHDSHGVLLDTAVKAGFTYWEEPGVANIPVYRLF